MMSFFGAHYRELVIIAMTLFAVVLFSVSITDLKHRAKASHRD
jgi:hypothetical protein